MEETIKESKVLNKQLNNYKAGSERDELLQKLQEWDEASEIVNGLKQT